ncbi:MAG TPA: hypothetical protein PK995_03035 [Bacteroidia bacterium]|jgi:hypothetical protein|nr:hypothetical protein [Bacteroidia bacterium]
MIRKEILVFIICFIVAFAWWVVHQLNQTYIREYNINTVIVKVPESYDQDSIVVNTKIKVKGSGLKIVLLENYLPENIYLPFKKLKKAKKKVFTIPYDAISENEQFPVKLKILEITPDTIRIEFNKNQKK